MRLALSDNTSSTPGEIITQTVLKYASLTSYADEGAITVVEGQKSYNLPFSLKLSRPYLYRIACHKVRSPDTLCVYWSASDGDYAFDSTGQRKLPSTWRYDRELSEANKKQFTLDLNLANANPAGTVARLFFSLAPDMDRLLKSEGDLKREPDEAMHGIDCYVISYHHYGTATFWIRKADFLIQQIQTVQSAQDRREEMIAVSDGMIETPIPAEASKVSDGKTVTETHLNIVINQPIDMKEFSR